MLFSHTPLSTQPLSGPAFLAPPRLTLCAPLVCRPLAATMPSSLASCTSYLSIACAARLCRRLGCPPRRLSPPLPPLGAVLSLRSGRFSSHSSSVSPATVKGFLVCSAAAFQRSLDSTAHRAERQVRKPGAAGPHEQAVQGATQGAGLCRPFPPSFSFSRVARSVVCQRAHGARQAAART